MRMLIGIIGATLTATGLASLFVGTARGLLAGLSVLGLGLLVDALRK